MLDSFLVWKKYATVVHMIHTFFPLKYEIRFKKFEKIVQPFRNLRLIEVFFGFKLIKFVSNLFELIDDSEHILKKIGKYWTIFSSFLSRLIGQV